MIQSMTGFARHMRHTEWGHISWEMRSINHRYLDLHFHLPDQWRELEAELRKELQSALTRGKIDIYLSYVNHEVHSALQINPPVVRALAAIQEQLKPLLPNMNPINLFDVLRWPGALKTEHTPAPEVKTLIQESFKETLELLVTQRVREGASLGKLLLSKLAEITEKMQILIPRREQLLSDQRQKFVNRIQALQLTFDTNRLEQELLIWAQKSDITEEIDRLNTHITEASHILQKGGNAIGRQLEFLVQELLREANTLSSKSNDTVLTTVAVDTKVCIEQIREQLQNIA